MSEYKITNTTIKKPYSMEMKEDNFSLTLSYWYPNFLSICMYDHLISEELLEPITIQTEKFYAPHVKEYILDLMFNTIDITIRTYCGTNFQKKNHLETYFPAFKKMLSNNLSTIKHFVNLAQGV